MGPGDDGVGGGGWVGMGLGYPPPPQNPPNKRGNSLSSRALSTLLSSTPDRSPPYHFNMSCNGPACSMDVYWPMGGIAYICI